MNVFSVDFMNGLQLIVDCLHHPLILLLHNTNLLRQYLSTLLQNSNSLHHISENLGHFSSPLNQTRLYLRQTKLPPPALGRFAQNLLGKDLFQAVSVA